MGDPTLSPPAGALATERDAPVSTRAVRLAADVEPGAATAVPARSAAVTIPETSAAALLRSAPGGSGGSGNKDSGT